MGFADMASCAAACKAPTPPPTPTSYGCDHKTGTCFDAKGTGAPFADKASCAAVCWSRRGVKCACNLVPCGQCQDGCTPLPCPNGSSRNGCHCNGQLDNGGYWPSYCCPPSCTSGQISCCPPPAGSMPGWLAAA